MIELSRSGDVAGLLTYAKKSIHDALEALAPSVAENEECDVVVPLLQALASITAIEDCHMGDSEAEPEAKAKPSEVLS